MVGGEQDVMQGKAEAEEGGNGSEESRWTRLSFGLRALHLFTLCTLAFAKPVYDVTGSEAAFFVVRGSRPVDIVSLIVILSLLLPAALVLVEGVLRGAGRRVQAGCHLLLVGLLASIYSAQFVKTWKLDGPVALAAILAGGVFCALLYARTESFRRLVTLASPFVILIPLYFIFGTPVGKILLPGGFTWTDARDKSTHVYLKKKPPIVFVVMDELPIVSLLDANGAIDAKRFPNLAAFAATAKWYRNTTSVSPTTETAVPAILTGIFPEGKKLPNITDHPDNIFTLLAGNYKFNVYESACNLCPEGLGATHREQLPYRERLQTLLEDVGVVYLHRVLPVMFSPMLPPITNRWGNFLHKEEKRPDPAASRKGNVLSRKEIAEKLLSMKKGDRPEIFRSFISDIDPRRKDTFNFIHVLLPHGPFEYLPSTNKYQAVSELGLEGATKTNDKFTGPQELVDQYHQLHLLQLAAMDKLIGELMGKLKSTGLFDESLIVMVADHGTSFKSNDFNRELSGTNAADIMFVPLFIKLPGQQKSEVEELDAETDDVMPTVADYLGVTLPWKASGVSLLAAGRKTRSTKRMAATDGVHSFELAQLLRMRQQTLANNVKIFGLDQKNSNLFWFGEPLDVLGKKVSEVEVKRDKGAAIGFEQEHLFSAVDPKQGLLPAMIKGEVTGSRGGNERVAISVNGVIQAAAAVHQINGKRVFTAVVPDSAFKPGRNEVEGFLLGRYPDGRKYLVSAKHSDAAYSLRNSDLISSDGKAYPIVAASMPGVVDELRPVAKELSISGWATDLKNSELVDEVMVFADGKFLLAGRTTEARPDIARAYKTNRLQMAGFRFLVPAATDKRKIRVFAVSDGVAYELNYQAKLGLKADYLKKAYATDSDCRLRDNALVYAGKAVKNAPDQINGSVDLLKKDGKSLTVAGWAADIKKGKEVDCIAVFFKDALVALGRTRVSRTDIARLAKARGRSYFGFEYALPLAKVKDPEELRLFAISEGVATELVLPKKTRLDGDKFALGSDALLPSGGGAVNVYPNSLQGKLDRIEVKAKKLLVSGWAADLRQGIPVDAVVIFNGTQFIGAGKPNITRTDVGAAYNQEKLATCGFDFAIKSPLRDVGQIRVFVVSRGVAMELENPKSARAPAPAEAPEKEPALVLEDDRLFNKRGESLEIHNDLVQGSVDLATRKGGRVIIDGWAANLQQGKPAEQVHAFYDDRLVASAKPRVARPDVAKAYGNDKLDYCGYSLSIAADKLESLGRVRIFAVVDGAATELNNAVLLKDPGVRPAGDAASFHSVSSASATKR